MLNQTETQDPPTFPIVYAIELNAPNGAAGYKHGDLLLLNTIEEPTGGDLVCVHPRVGGALMVVLTMGLPPFAWERMPYREDPKADTSAILCGTVLGTTQSVQFLLHDLIAVHKCDGKADPADCAI